MFATASLRHRQRAFLYRAIHQSVSRHAVTQFRMPAMSPTMTEGGIAQWKKKEGDSFSAGDVLLEIETDKATIDVEANEDGILGKIILADGTKAIPVGKAIALLVEPGDDISNLEVPEETPSTPAKSTVTPPPSTPPPPPSPSPPKKPSHAPSEAIFPSVMRLLSENDIDPKTIKGTGKHGMLTKGDVLAFLGKASSPTGTYRETKKETMPAIKEPASKPLNGQEVRRLIMAGLSSLRKPPPLAGTTPTFDSVLADYDPSKAHKTDSHSPSNSSTYLNGLI